MICVNKFCVKKIFFTKLLSGLVMSVLFSSCASTTEPDTDPLKHSRKLIREGHSSLYNNGAFEVPFTEIKLIPAGKKPLELASEMMGMRARQAFLTSLKNAADSIYLIPAGTKLSLDYAKKIQGGGEKAGESITDVTRPVGIYLVKRSVDLGKDMTVKAWSFGNRSASAMHRYGISIEEHSLSGGATIAEQATKGGVKVINKSWELSKNISQYSTQGAKKSILYAGDEFIKGYVAVPEKLGERGSEIAKAARLSNFSKGIKESYDTVEKYNTMLTELVSDTAGNYVSNVKYSFNKSGEAFNESVGVAGFGLAFIKSARWVLQGVLWDGLIEPVSKLGTASVGYIAVNLVAYPSMVVVNEGIAVTNLAVEVTWNTARAGYDLVAPTATAAVASVYSLFQLTAGNMVAGATAVGGGVVGSGAIVVGQVVGNTAKGVGYIAGKGVQYIGVPLTAAGVTVGAGTVGVVAGGVGAVAGSTVLVSGEVASAGSQVFGNVIAGTTVVTGTTASVVAGTAVGVYELSKAVIVPTGYELGGGIVLGYGAVSQLAAHSVLAVTDASYLVLSLEGPRWVIYSVQGKLGEGDELPPGTLLDLEAMQENGEQFSYLPVSDKEMKSVVDSVYHELPEKNDMTEGESF